MKAASFAQLAPAAAGIAMLLACATSHPVPAAPASAEAPAQAEAPASEEPLLADDLLEEDGDLAFDLADPLEPGNRVIFSGNEYVYRWVFDPIARGYRKVVPDSARRAVRRFFANLNLPAAVVNDLLQLNPRRAAVAGSRFVVNSTLGIAGLFDPATTRFGLQSDPSDFGETLGVHGVPPGPYLIIPLLGPSTARDVLGSVVDAVLRPDFWLLVVGPYIYLLAASNGMTSYEGQQMHMEELRRSSVDFYSALRSAYAMNREANIRQARLR